MATTPSGDKGTRNLVIGMISFIVVVGVVFSLISSRSNSTAAIPATVSEADGYGIVLNPESTPKIDVYVDYQCPACRMFEIINGGYLNEVIAQKKAKVVFHPMTFIGPESVLAANSAACAADENKFVDMNLALFQNQADSENSGKWSNEFLVELGKSIGITSGSFKTCVNDGKYIKWTSNVAAASAKADVNGTPTIFINGKQLDRNTEYGDQAKFRAALAAGGVK
ncbi:MAG: DsbA family protein [Candidatus Nanopelagicus sp.]|jgi:protein-disulfide isomerase